MSCLHPFVWFVFVCWNKQQIVIEIANQLSWAINYVSTYLLVWFLHLLLARPARFTSSNSDYHPDHWEVHSTINTNNIDDQWSRLWAGCHWLHQQHQIAKKRSIDACLHWLPLWHSRMHLKTEISCQSLELGWYCWLKPWVRTANSFRYRSLNIGH